MVWCGVQLCKVQWPPSLLLMSKILILCSFCDITIINLIKKIILVWYISFTQVTFLSLSFSHDPKDSWALTQAFIEVCDGYSMCTNAMHIILITLPPWPICIQSVLANYVGNSLASLASISHLSLVDFLIVWWEKGFEREIINFVLLNYNNKYIAVFIDDTRYLILGCTRFLMKLDS